MTWLLIAGFIIVAALLMVWWVWLIEYPRTDGDD